MKTPAQWRRSAAGKKPHCMTVEERFWLKVDIRGEDECWLWLARVGKNGYGAFRLNGQRRAHRVAYELTKGALGRLFACHRCDTPACCNPRHLFAGTNSDNIKDCIAKGRHVNNGFQCRKLSVSEAALIRNSRMPQNYLAQLFEVTQTTISRIRRSERYKETLK